MTSVPFRQPVSGTRAVLGMSSVSDLLIDLIESGEQACGNFGSESIQASEPVGIAQEIGVQS